MSKDIEWSIFTILVLLICFLQKIQSLNQTISDEKCDDTEETFICAISRNSTDDFKTFASRCALATYNCQHKHGLQYIYRSDGQCPNTDPQKQCPRPCVAPHYPVCGSLKGFGPHITFPSLCELENYNCEHKIAQYKIVFNGRCEDINCTKVCGADDSPICAAPVIGTGEPQTFKNFCELRNYNCYHRDKEYGIVNLGACPAHPIAPPLPPPSASKQCGECESEQKPVCGRIPNTGEGRTFESRCALDRFNCLHDGHNDYKYVQDGTCDQLCSGNCPREYDPVCARSLLGDKPPQTFNNLCLLNYYNCQGNISGSGDIFEFFYDGICQIEPTQPPPTVAPPPQCPLQCNLSYVPICAESRENPELKRTFSSVCELYNHNCLFKHDVYYIIENKTCVENNSCVQTCPDTPQILCASPQNQLGPNVEFRNRCYLNNYNCIHFYSKYDFLHNGSCLPTVTQPAPTRRPPPITTPLPCKRTCSTDYAPVCAVSKRSKTEVTFHNHCEMSNYNCDFSTDESFEFSHGGKCEAEVIPRPPIQPEQTCLKVCTDDYSPVCASYDWGYGMKTTFRSRCLLDNYNCDHRLFNYKILYEGECVPEVLPGPPSLPMLDCRTIQCTGEYKPVCAVQYLKLGEPRTFINRCIMNRHNCELIDRANELYEVISEGECPPKSTTTTTTTTRPPPPQCPIPCEEDKNLVCATSRENPNIRRTFSSDCNLYNHNCLTMHDIYDFTAWDACPEFVPPKNNSCFSTCPDTEQTLCAFPENRLGPNVEFRNRCYLNNYNCIHDSYTRYNFLHDGPCQPTQTEPPTETPTKPPCKISCTEGYNPICAVSKLHHSKATFKNICEMDNYNCDYSSYGFEYSHPGKCQAEVIETPPVKPTCLRVCTQEYLPVCASQIWGLGMKRTFENRCVLENYNCENFLFKFEIINEGECKADAIPESPSLPMLDCRNIQCTRENHPICTTSQRQPGVTKAFSNRCMMNMYNCEHTNDQFEFLHYGLCKSTTPETNPGFSCIKDCECTRRPICAAPRHGTGPRKTFTNRCKLDNYNCENVLNPYDYDYDGECRPQSTPAPPPALPSLPLNCIKDCECDYKPVCASAIHKQSPQRTFQNRCKLENHNCEFYTDQYRIEFEGECPKFEKLIMREVESSQNKYDCIKACPQTYEPICTAPNEGTNFMSFKRTFHNMCELENHNCIFTISRYSVLHTGECPSEIKPTYQ